MKDFRKVREVALGNPRKFLDKQEMAVVEFSNKITRSPHAMRKSDVSALRKAGFTDEQILQIVQIAAYFNYINRVVDALGVPLDEFLKPFERKLKRGT